MLFEAWSSLSFQSIYCIHIYACMCLCNSWYYFFFVYLYISWNYSQAIFECKTKMKLIYYVTQLFKMNKFDFIHVYFYFFGSLHYSIVVSAKKKRVFNGLRIFRLNRPVIYYCENVKINRTFWISCKYGSKYNMICYIEYPCEMIKIK